MNRIFFLLIANIIISGCRKDISIKPDPINKTPCVRQDTLPESVGQWHIDTFPLPICLNNRDIFFINRQIGFVLQDQYTLSKTTNGGQTWIETYKFNGGTGSGKIYFINENIGFLTNEYKPGAYFWMTVDGGKTWEKRILPINNFLEKIQFTDSLNGLALIGTYKNGNQIITSLFKTEDQCRTWSNIPVADTLSGNYLQFLDNTKVFTLARKNDTAYVLKSVDGGLTWKAMGNLPVNYFKDLILIDEQNGIMTNYNRYFTTSDGGLTWQEKKDIEGSIKILSAGKSSDLLMISQTEQCFHGDYSTYQGQFLSFENNEIIRSRNVTDLFFYITSFKDNTFGYGIKRNKLFRFTR